MHDKGMEKLQKRIIFYIALLSIYFILTAMTIFIFEYYTVAVTDGKIIFSLAMSWQVILFAAELVTIVLQVIMLVMILKKYSHRKYMTLRISGITAGILAFAAVIYILASDGIKIYPALIFIIYMLVVVTVRTFLIPHSASKLSEFIKK